MEVIKGTPNSKHISTSYVERLNWSTRTSNRRYTRLSNGFSRKLEDHEAAVALNTSHTISCGFTGRCG
jgi:IS1 family transposase